MRSTRPALMSKKVGLLDTSCRPVDAFDTSTGSVDGFDMWAGSCRWHRHVGWIVSLASTRGLDLSTASTRGPDRVDGIDTLAGRVDRVDRSVQMCRWFRQPRPDMSIP
jgi:hypothetical protein